MSRVRPAPHERGQATPLVGAVVAVVVVLLLVVSHLGAATADRAAARTAADAAALAAATASAVGEDARSAAEVAAGRNRAALEAIEVAGDRVEVTVRLGRATASAAATVAGPRRRPPGWAGGP